MGTSRTRSGRFTRLSSNVGKAAHAASSIAFDLLALGDEDPTGQPVARRRAELEQALHRARPPAGAPHPATTDRSLAVRWLEQFEGTGRWTV